MSTQDASYSETTFNAGQKLCKVKVTFGSTSVASSKGRAAVVTRTGTGALLVTFNKKWNHLAGYAFGWFRAGAGEVLQPCIVTDSILSAGTLAIELRASTGTATDAASGDVLWLTFTLDTLGLSGQ